MNLHRPSNSDRDIKSSSCTQSALMQLTKRKYSPLEQANRWIICHCNLYAIEFGSDVIKIMLNYFDNDFDTNNSSQSWMYPIRVYISFNSGQHLPYLMYRYKSIKQTINEILMSNNIAIDEYGKYELWQWRGGKYRHNVWLQLRKEFIVAHKISENGKYLLCMERPRKSIKRKISKYEEAMFRRGQLYNLL